MFTATIQGVFIKSFGRRGIPAPITYSGLVTAFSLVFFVATGWGSAFGPEIIPYSLGFAAAYVVCTVTNVLALNWGSLAITSLILSYSLVIPTLYGLIFLNEPLGIGKLIGLGVLCVALFLVKGEELPQKKKVSARWLIAVSVCFVTNGCCSVLQKAQQAAFDGRYNSGFMILALSLAAAASLITAAIAERKYLKQALRWGLLPAALGGLCNGATNLLVMVIVGMVAASLFFPLLSAGQLVLVFALSVLLYKEKFLPRQLVGLALGLGALVLLNL